MFARALTGAIGATAAAGGGGSTAGGRSGGSSRARAQPPAEQEHGGKRVSVFERLSAAAAAAAASSNGTDGQPQKQQRQQEDANERRSVYARLGNGQAAVQPGSSMDVDPQQRERPRGSISAAVQRAVRGVTATPAAAANTAPSSSKRKADGPAAAAAGADSSSAAAAATQAKKPRPAAGDAAPAAAAAAPGVSAKKASQLAALRAALAAKEAEVKRLKADADADARSVVVFGVSPAVTDGVLRAHFGVCGGGAGAIKRATLLPSCAMPGAPGAYVEFQDSSELGPGGASRPVSASRAVLMALGLSGTALLGQQITVGVCGG
jgi:hypothetical protein